MRTSKIIACLILSCCVHSLKAQDTIPQNVMNKASIQVITDTTFHSQVDRNMLYRTTVKIISDPSFRCNGALYEVNDSSISISSKRTKDYYSGSVEAIRFPVGDLKLIHTRKTGNGGKGAWIGAVSGVALGTLFGALSGGNAVLRTGDAMVVGAAFGFVVGVPTGFIVGRIAGHKRIPINGSMDEFNLNKDKLKDYAIKK